MRRGVGYLASEFRDHDGDVDPHDIERERPCGERENGIVVAGMPAGVW